VKLLSMRSMSVLGAVALALILVAQLNGKGDDPYHALEVYAAYMPGSPMPDDLLCFSMSEYLGSVGMKCPIEATPYCHQGYLVVYDGRISYTNLSDCQLPVAYLIARHGRYEYVGDFRRTAIIIWDGLSAQANQVGSFTTMYAVSSVSWWDSPG
jgi:hypothetical protein